MLCEWTCVIWFGLTTSPWWWVEVMACYLLYYFVCSGSYSSNDLPYTYYDWVCHAEQAYGSWLTLTSVGWFTSVFHDTGALRSHLQFIKKNVFTFGPAVQWTCVLMVPGSHTGRCTAVPALFVIIMKNGGEVSLSRLLPPLRGVSAVITRFLYICWTCLTR